MTRCPVCSSMTPDGLCRTCCSARNADTTSLIDTIVAEAIASHLRREHEDDTAYNDAYDVAAARAELNRRLPVPSDPEDE